MLAPNARAGIFPANDALPAMSDLENKLHAATDSYDQYEVRSSTSVLSAGEVAICLGLGPCVALQ